VPLRPILTRALKSALLCSLALAPACGPQAPPDDPVALAAGKCKNALPLLEGVPYRAVILPSDLSRKTLKLQRVGVEDTFRPSDDSVRELEAGLREAVQARLTEASRQVESPAREKDVARMEHIKAGLDRTARQYAGIVVGGARRVLVNAFPDDAYCYRDEFISMQDGGAQFWRVQYDLSLKQFVHWEVNPD
jgi:hypothetical protein